MSKSTVTSAVVIPSTDSSPTGWCWCGCGETTKGGHFSPGHDMKALKGAMKSVGYESVAAFIASHKLVPSMPAGFVRYEAPKPEPKAPVAKPVEAKKPASVVVKKPEPKAAPVVMTKAPKAKKAA